MNTISLMLAWRYLSRRRLRALLTTLAITLAVMLIFGMNSIIPAVAESFRQSFQSANGEADLTVQLRSGLSFDVALAEEVATVSGVAAVSPALRQTLTLPAGGALPSLGVAGVEPESALAVRAIPVKEGRFLHEDDTDAMVLPAPLAEQAGLRVGDRLTLPASQGTASFTIIGLSAAPPVPGSSEALISLAAAQALFNAPGQVNSIQVRAAANADVATVSEAVQARLGERFTLEAADPLGAFTASIALGEAAIALFGVIALAMGAFIIFNSFRTAVTERRRDIGLLRAVGASRGTVLATLLVESLLLGLVGTGVGVVLGYALAWLAMAGVQAALGNTIGIQYGTPTFRLPLLALSLLMGTGTALLGGLLPAWGATHVTPLEALRPSTTGAESHAISWSTWLGAVLVAVALATLLSQQAALATLGALLFLAGLALLTPLLLRPLAGVLGALVTLIFAREGMLAQGNLERQPGRAAVTASAVMIGLAVVVAMAGLTQSIISGSLRYMEQSLGADYIFLPTSLVLGSGNIGAGPELAEAIGSAPGIEEVATMRVRPTLADGQPIQLLGIDPISYPRVAGLLFSEGEPEAAYQALSANEGILINGFLAAQYGVGVGDSLEIETPQGERAYPVVGIASDFLNVKAASAYLSQAALAETFGVTNDVLLMANETADAVPATTLAHLERITAQYPAFSVTAAAPWQAMIRQAMQAAMGAFYVLMVFLALPALLALANTLAMNVLERTRELGLLRAVGAARRQVQRMILAESLLLAAIGTAFGILAGLWLGRALLVAMNSSGFSFPYFFPSAGILLGVAVGLLFGVLAALMPARRAARLDIVKALRYE